MARGLDHALISREARLEDRRQVSSVAVPYNKQLQRTVIGRRVRGACASLHYAHAPRWTAQRAAAELRRYTALEDVIP
jgi:hypothetical protein